MVKASKKINGDLVIRPQLKGSRSRLITPPNFAPLIRAHILVVFLFLLVFLTICFFFHMLDQISIKLGQNDQWVSGYKSYQQFDLKGHVGVTGVKNVICTENATPPTRFIRF